jgi:hypothetical protein
MDENRIKKDMYNSSPIDLRTHVKVGDDDEIAMKPYYYFRNGKLHIRYNVDRCVNLTPSEVAGLKVTLASTYDKQTVLAKAWNFFTTCVKKEVIRDGIAEAEKSIREYNENGRTY